jgi:hypothetical protein
MQIGKMNMANKFDFVTTFHKEGYDKYGKRMIETFDTCYPKDINLTVYYEGMEKPEIGSERIIYRNYDEICGEKQKAFEVIAKPHQDRVLGPNGIDPRPERGGKPVTEGSRYLFDATRFAHKYYACADFINKSESQYTVWCDADVVAMKPIPNEWLNTLVAEDKYWTRVGRVGKYPECGFMIWNRNHPQHQAYWNLMEQCYDQGSLFQLKEWHDSYVWWAAEGLIEQHTGINTSIDLGQGFSGHAFVHGVLGEYLDHLKGNRKDLGFSPERIQSK